MKDNYKKKTTKKTSPEPSPKNFQKEMKLSDIRGRINKNDEVRQEKMILMLQSQMANIAQRDPAEFTNKGKKEFNRSKRDLFGSARYKG